MLTTEHLIELLTRYVADTDIPQEPHFIKRLKNRSEDKGRVCVEQVHHTNVSESVLRRRVYSLHPFPLGESTVGSLSGNTAMDRREHDHVEYRRFTPGRGSDGLRITRPLGFNCVRT